MNEIRSIDVFASVAGEDFPAGRAVITGSGRGLRTRFSYAPEWLGDARSYDLGCDCPRSAGGCDVAGLPGFLQDAAPDWWGRMLIRRAWPADARRGICEADYLLGVDDWARMGNIRLSLDGGTSFVGSHTDIPAIVDLTDLLADSRAAKLDSGESGEAAVARLLHVGSSALGGARPKATVQDGETLWLAKFPSSEDEWDVEAWEYLVLQVAKRVGIDVPEMRLVEVVGKHVLLSKRFDREGAIRVPYMSGRSLLQADDTFDADYYDLANRLREVSYRPKQDIWELFKRLVFNIAIHNIDDHLRNFGFVRDELGWKLAPAFDVNPDPYLANSRVTSIFSYVSAGEEHGAVRFAEDFDIEGQQSRAFVGQLAEILDQYEGEARACGHPEQEAVRFARVVDDRVRALLKAFG